MTRCIALFAILAAGCSHPLKYYAGEDDTIRDGESVIDERPEAGDAEPQKMDDDQPKKKKKTPKKPPPLVPDDELDAPMRKDPSDSRAPSPAPTRAAPAGMPVARAVKPRIPYRWPIGSDQVEVTFGVRPDGALHKGIDVSCDPGTPTFAAADGEVTFAGDSGARGRTVEVAHRDGTHTVYAHLTRIDVAIGEKVASGQAVGLAGAPGKNVGPHLHFEVWQDGQVVDPLDFYGVNKKNAALPDVAAPLF